MRRMMIKGVCCFWLLGIVFGAYELYGQEVSETQEAQETQEMTAANRITSRVKREASIEGKTDSTYSNPFFFPDGAGSYVYQPEFLLFDENGGQISYDEAELKVARVKRAAQGILYRYEICCEGEFYHGEDSFEIGYFYVNRDKIIRLTEEEAALKRTSEEDFLQEGTIVCQESDKPDALEAEEKGWHEYIVIEQDRCEYHSWNSLVETGFYETFIWERGKGLVSYRQGYGAGRDYIAFSAWQMQYPYQPLVFLLLHGLFSRTCTHCI